MPSLNYYQQEHARMEHERKEQARKASIEDSHSGRRWGVNGSEYFDENRRSDRGSRSGLDPGLVEKHLEGRRSRHKNRKTRTSSKYFFDSSGSDEENKLYEELARERRKLTVKDEPKPNVDKKSSKDRRKDRSLPRENKHLNGLDRTKARMESSDDISDETSRRERRRDNLRRITRTVEAMSKSDEDSLEAERRPKYSNGEKSRKSRTLPKHSKLTDYKKDEETSSRPRSRTGKSKDRDSKQKERSSRSRNETEIPQRSRKTDEKVKTHRRTKSRDNVLDVFNENNNNNESKIPMSVPKPISSTLFVKPVRKMNHQTETEGGLIERPITTQRSNGYSYGEKETTKIKSMKRRSLTEGVVKQNRYEERKQLLNGIVHQSKMEMLTRSVDNVNLDKGDMVSRSVDNVNLAMSGYPVERQYKERKVKTLVPKSKKTKEIILGPRHEVQQEPPESQIPRLPSQESTTSNSTNISEKLLSLKEPDSEADSLQETTKPSNKTYMQRIAWKRKPKTKNTANGAHSETEIEIKHRPFVSGPTKDEEVNGTREQNEIRKSSSSPFLGKPKKEVMSEPESKMKQLKKQKSPFIRRKNKKDVTKLTTLQYRPSDLGYTKTREQRKTQEISDKEMKPFAEDNISIGSRSSNNTTSTSTDMSSVLSSQRTSSTANGSLDKYKEKSNEIIFTVNLDKNQNNILPMNKTSSTNSSTGTNKSSIFFVGNGKSRTLSTSSAKSQNNKWNQTNGPPIRPPPSETISTQTAINPAMCKSVKTQLKPWNLDDQFFHCSTQTPKNSRDAVTQTTPQPKHVTISTQCEVKEFTTCDAQTDNPVMCDSGMSAIATTETIETQTEEEGSKIWGSAVSLDRLIRSRAMKQRSRSLTNGLDENDLRGHSRSRSVGRLNSTGEELDNESIDQETKSGKISSYSWSQTNKFVKIFVSYSGVHLIPTKLIAVKTNGINLNLSIKEPTSEQNDLGETLVEKSSLKLPRLTRPVAALSYTVQRDMITIMLRKQKAIEWGSLLYGQSGSLVASKSENNLLG